MCEIKPEDCSLYKCDICDDGKLTDMFYKELSRLLKENKELKIRIKVKKDEKED